MRRKRPVGPLLTHPTRRDRVIDLEARTVTANTPTETCDGTATRSEEPTTCDMTPR